MHAQNFLTVSDFSKGCTRFTLVDMCVCPILLIYMLYSISYITYIHFQTVECVASKLIKAKCNAVIITFINVTLKTCENFICDICNASV